AGRPITSQPLHRRTPPEGSGRLASPRSARGQEASCRSAAATDVVGAAVAAGAAGAAGPAGAADAAAGAGSSGPMSVSDTAVPSQGAGARPDGTRTPGYPSPDGTGRHSLALPLPPCHPPAAPPAARGGPWPPTSP